MVRIICCTMAFILVGCAGTRAGPSPADGGERVGDQQIAFPDTIPGADLWARDGLPPAGDLGRDLGIVDAPPAKQDAQASKCSAKTADGIALNPGCDPDVKAGGVSAISSALDTSTSTSWWLVVKGKKWWSYGTPPGSKAAAFIAGGRDVAAFLRTLQPSCASRTADGTALNPGCDAGVKVNGLTALGSTIDAAGQTAWLVISGKKWWIYGLDTVKVARFLDGGKDVAEFFRRLSPGGTAKTKDGLALNPGFDATVQVNGLTAVGSATSATGTSWLAASGRKWWTYTNQTATKKPAFVDGGTDVAKLFATFKPSCAVKTADGIPLNAGCDPTVQANGVTALGNVRDPTSGATVWFGVSGKKWWTVSGATATFTAGGRDIAAFFRTLRP